MRLGIVADIHSDLAGLRQALTALETQQCDRLACLGDIVGFSGHYDGSLDGREGDKCVRIIRSVCDYVVAGNHDLFPVKKIPEHFTDLGLPSDWYRHSIEERRRLSGDRVWLYDDEYPAEYSPESIEYLAGLPETLILREENILLSHFIYPDLTGSAKAAPVHQNDFDPHFKFLKKNLALIGLTGHKHPDGYAEITEKQLGMYDFRKNPLADPPVILITPPITRGAVRPGYMILDTSGKSVEAITF